MHRRWLLPFGAAAVFVLVIGLSVWTPTATGYPTYTENPGCGSCHGGFRDGPYIDFTDGQSWGDDLHDVHRFDMLSGECDACHLGAGFGNTFLNEADPANGLEGLSCIGCHGRAEDRGIRPGDCVDPGATNGPCGDGAGLRQHHFRNFVTECVNCHLDSDPANFTTAGEQFPPPHYFTPDPAHPTKPTDPCNPPPDFPEDFAASMEALDNDGNDLYDQDDPGCVGNTPPVAEDDAYSTDEDTQLVVAAPGVLDNDTDADGDTLTAVLVTDVGNGSLSLAADGSFTYDPDADYNGPDSFTYKADDGTDESNVATVSLTINDVNDPPTADPNGPYNGTAGDPVTFDGSGSSDVDGTVQSYAWDFGDGNTGTGVGPTHTYADPGTFTVTLTVTDDDGDDSAPETTTAEIQAAANEPPVAEDDGYSTDEDTQLVIAAPGVLDNDNDPDGGPDPLSAILVSGAANGTVALNPDGSFTYDPNLNYNGPDAFTYKANDGADDSNTATVSLTVNDINDPPIADPNGPYNGTVGQPVAFDGSGSSDIDGTVQSYTWDFGDGGGGSGVNPTHTYADPGTFTVTLTVTDDDGAGSAPAMTTAVIQAQPNEPPVAMDDAFATDEDMQLVVGAPGVLANDNDPDGGPDPLSAILVSGAANGAVILNPDGSFTYDPNPDYNGPDAFTYQANDGADNSNVATVSLTINDINDPPIADPNGPYNGTVGQPVAFDGSGSSDIDGTIQSYTWDFGDGGGGSGINPTHTYADPGTFTVTLAVTDDDGAGSVPAMTTAVIQAQPNEPPVAMDDAFATDEDMQLVVAAPGVLANDNDPDGGPDPLSAILTSGAANGTVNLNPDGSFTYDPNPDYNGPDAFTYQANDGADNSNVATVSLMVNDVNDPPIADPNGPYNGIVGQPVAFDGSGSSDIDGTIQSYAWDFGDGGGGSGVNPTHTYADPGTFTVTLTVTDDDGAMDSATTSATIDEPGQEIADLDIAQFKTTRRVRLGSHRVVQIRLKVFNAGSVDQPRPATVVGMQSGLEIYNEVLPVSDPLGGGSTKVDFPSYMPTAAGTIHWTATIADDDPDLDRAFSRTEVDDDHDDSDDDSDPDDDSDDDSDDSDDD